MRKSSIFFTFIILLCIGGLGYYLWILQHKPAPLIKIVPKEVPKAPEKKILLKEDSYNNLPGWKNDDLPEALAAFQVSCKWVLKKDKDANVGNDIVPIKAKDWFNVCNAAIKLEKTSKDEVQKFFESSFVPMTWSDDTDKNGLFTGYYSPLYEGSLKRDSVYTVPVYGKPKDLISINLQKFDPQLPERSLVGRVNNQQLIPYYTRKEIDRGAIKDQAQVVAWLKDEVDRLFLEIQGAGTIKLAEGGNMPLGYVAENGGHYRSVAQVLIRRGVLTKESASMQAIRRYVKAHPVEGRAAIHVNESFVFFNPLKSAYTPGTQGIPLTAGYSMAVDRKWVPLGVPLWLSTKRPDEHHPSKPVSLARLMIAQDTGGAIRGKVRGDVFWGTGKVAATIAGNMKYYGTYWLLMPKSWVSKYKKTIVASSSSQN